MREKRYREMAIIVWNCDRFHRRVKNDSVQQIILRYLSLHKSINSGRTNLWLISYKIVGYFFTPYTYILYPSAIETLYFILPSQLGDFFSSSIPFFQYFLAFAGF